MIFLALDENSARLNPVDLVPVGHELDFHKSSPWSSAVVIVAVVVIVGLVYFFLK